jgi:phosphoesterase RecJ-like protein
MNKKSNDGEVIKQIREKLLLSQKPLITSHIRPDGDAIGSIIGLGLTLRENGKNPKLVLIDGLPEKYRFLVGSNEVSKLIPDEYDLAIALDCADSSRLGKAVLEIPIDINIDHHITNNLFGKLNLVQPDQAATSSILADILPKMGFTIHVDAASALLMGILTDTIGYRTSNVSADTMRLSAGLIDTGACLPELYEKTLISQTFSASQLWGFALSRLVQNVDIIWTSITLEDRRLAKYSGRDDADLTNILSAIEKTKVSILFNEQNNNKVKVSWRSSSEVDVSKIAASFGGGGHPPAAGAEINGSLEQVQEIVLDRTRQNLSY